MQEIQRILLALDFSENSDDALRLSCELARGLKAEIVLVYVDEVAATVAGSSLATEHLTWASRQLQKTQAQLETQGCRVQALLREGTPVAEILAAAEASGASMIVPGSYGHSTVSSLLLGTAADRVLRRLKI